VAKGYTQQEVIYFYSTFSTVVKATTIRLVLSVAVTRGWRWMSKMPFYMVS